MKGCLIALGIPVGLMILVIGLFWLNFYDVHVRYRLTVEVRDGDLIKTGSSVIEASYDIQPAWSWSGPGNRTPVVGYAPTVDLGDKGMLFLTFSDATRTGAQIVERNNYVFCADNVRRWNVSPGRVWHRLIERCARLRSHLALRPLDGAGVTVAVEDRLRLRRIGKG